MKVSRKLSFELVLFTAFFATLPVYSPNMFAVHDGFDTDPQLQLFVPVVLVSILVICIAVAVLSARGHDQWMMGRISLFVSIVAYVVGYLVFSLQIFSNAFDDVLIIVSALILAVGTVGLSIIWGNLFSYLDMRQLMFFLALTIGVASGVQLLMQFLSAEARLLIFDFFAVIGSVPLVFLVAHLEHATDKDAADTDIADADMDRSYGESASSDTGEVSAAAERETPRIGSVFKRMAPVIATPLIGLMVFAFLTGVRKFVIFDFFYVEFMGGFIASLIVLIMCFAKTGRPLTSLYFNLLLPLFALVLIVLNSFPPSTPPLWVAASVSYVFFSLVAILALVSICGMAHAREFPPSLIFALTLGGYAAVSAFAVYCGSEFAVMQNEDGGPILLVVSTIYFAFLILMSILSGWKKEESEDISSADRAESFTMRCSAVAKNGALSPRESEILGYIGRGHSVAFVAKTLVISESTVRTHTKNIYRKLGVTSREELIEYIDKTPIDA